jgi:hypothetical protein
MDYTSKHRTMAAPRVLGIFFSLLLAYEVYVYLGFLLGSPIHQSILTHICSNDRLQPYCGLDSRRYFITFSNSRAVERPSRFLFIFGDSYSSIEYNSTSGAQPTLDNPFGNSEFSTATAYKDEKWIDIMFMEYPTRSTVVYDFATGGNLVNVSRMPEPFTFTTNVRRDMIDQVNHFTQIQRKVGWKASDSLFVSWFGMYAADLNSLSDLSKWTDSKCSNDIDAISVLSDLDVEAAKDVLSADVGDYFDQIAHLYGLGARSFIHITPPRKYSAPIFSLPSPSLSA